MVSEKGYDNRSLAIAGMIADDLVEHQRDLGDADVVGTVTLVYDHHKPHLQETLTELQHDHIHTIISARSTFISIITIASRFSSSGANSQPSRPLPTGSSAPVASNTAS